MALAIAGCGSFNPPPPPELSTLPDARSAGSGILLEFLPSSTPNPEREKWSQAIRVDAGLNQITLLETPAPPGSSSAWRADRIRTAGARGVKVLIVEADDVAAVTTALEDAHHQGVRVLIIGGTTDQPTLPFATRVRFGGLDSAVEQMILAVRDTLKAVGLPTDGPALIVSSPDAGPLSHALADHIESALKAAGTRSVARLKIPENITEGDKIVAERLAAEPRIVQVFAVDNPAFAPIQTAYRTIKTHGELVMAGALAIDSGTDQRGLRSQFAALIDRRLATFGRTVLKSAVKLGRGEKVEPDVVVPLEVLTASKQPTPSAKEATNK